MALHGDVAINGVLLGVWQARRTEDLQHGRSTYTYDCQVDWTARNGTRQRSTFTLTHDYDQGAFALAAKVLSEVAGDA